MSSARISEQEAATSQAVEWLLELEGRDVSEERVSAWNTWLNADPRNKQAFDRLQTIQECIDAAPSLPSPSEEALPKARSWSQSFPKRLAAVLATLAVGLCSYFAFDSWQSAVVKTGTGELRRVQLEDGSTVTLGGESKIKAALKERIREVELVQGEAFFEVAKDPNRPFTVRVGDTSITAVGTSFDVRRSDSHITVAVAEGIVEIQESRRSSATRINAGNQIRVARSRDVTAESPILPLATVQVAVWREGRRQYLAEPLADVVADLNRYSSQRIVINDAQIGQLAITGAVDEREIGRWLRSLEAALPIDVWSDANGEIYLNARPPSQAASFRR